MKIKFFLLTTLSLSILYFMPKINSRTDMFDLTLDEVEVLSMCEAEFPNSSGTMVRVACVGEEGTCHIKRKEKVSTNYGTFDVWVDATCSGSEYKR